MRFIDQLPENPDPEQYGVYPLSVRYTYGGIAFMARLPERDLLIASSGFGFSGSGFAAGNRSWTAAELTHENAAVLRRVFSDTAPTAVLRRDRTVGVGDRLGIAAPGHIRVFRRYDAVPILAQQSIRELTLTGRTFENVLDSASWGVFREGYTGSFGADGDHLKTPAEVRLALSCGCTMITLDCSEHIHSEAAAMPAISSALSYFDGYTCPRLPANLLQAQRDYFGAHTYERTDSPRGQFFHTNWTGHGGSTAASTYSI